MARTAVLNKKDLISAVTQLVNVGVLSIYGLDTCESCKIYGATPYFDQNLAYTDMVINILGSNPVAQIKRNGKPKLPSTEEERLMLMGDLGALAPGIIPPISQTCAQIKMYGISTDDGHNNENEIFDFLDGKVVSEINTNGSATIGVYNVKKQKETQSLDYLNPKGKKKVCIVHCGKGIFSLNEPLKRDYPKYSLVDKNNLHFLLHSLGYDPTDSRKYIPENMI